MKKSTVLADIRTFRRNSGMNQTQFWSMFGMTQSAGSRFESGRNIPEPLAVLLVLCERGKVGEKDLRDARAVVAGERS